MTKQKIKTEYKKATHRMNIAKEQDEDADLIILLSNIGAMSVG